MGLPKDLIEFTTSTPRRYWLIPTIILLLIITPILALATLSYTGSTWQPLPGCGSGSGIKDFTIDPDNNHLYILTGNNKLEIDDVSSGGQTLKTCDSTSPAISTAVAIEYHDHFIFTNNRVYNITYTGGTPALTDLGTPSYNATFDNFIRQISFQFSPNQPIGAIQYERGDVGGNKQVTQLFRYNTTTGATTNTNAEIRCTTPISAFGIAQYMGGSIINYANGTYITDCDSMIRKSPYLSNGSITQTTPVTGGVTPSYQVNYTHQTAQSAASILLFKTRGYYDPSTQYYYYFVDAGSNQRGVQIADYSVSPAQIRGACLIATTATPEALYYAGTNEILAFYAWNNNTYDNIKCDFTNPTTPGYTYETNLNKAIFKYKTTTGTYAGRLFVAEETNATGTVFAQIRQVTGYNGSSSYNPTPTTNQSTILNTTINATRIGVFNTRPNDIYQDLQTANGLALITGKTPSGGNYTAFLLAIDTTNPPGMQYSPTYRATTITNPLRTLTNALGLAVQGSHVVAAAEDTLKRLGPANQLHLTANTQTLQSFSNDAYAEYYEYKDVAAIGNNQFLACVYDSRNELYHDAETDLYIINATNSSNITTTAFSVQNDAIGGAAITEPCMSIAADTARGVAFLDVGTRIYVINTTNMNALAAYITPAHTNIGTSRPTTLTYDPLQQLLTRAEGTYGMTVYDLTGDPYSSWPIYMQCGVSILYGYTTAATSIGDGEIFIGVGYTALGQNYLYTCDQSQGVTPTPVVYTIPTTTPKAVTYTSPYINILGTNTFSMYQITNATQNITNPNYTQPVTPSASVEFHVYDSVTLNPLPNVIIAINAYPSSTPYGPAITDAYGAGFIGNITPGESYTVTYIKTGYPTSITYINTLAANENINVTAYLNQQIIQPGLPNATNATTQNRNCQDYIKNVWLCNMDNTTCTTDNDCPSGMCVQLSSGGKCSTFNYNLCDADNTPRNQRCVIKMTFKGAMAGVTNHILNNFLYYAIILIIIFLIAALLISRRRNK